jgi:quercetin dioxygenase-like cupin family protein
MPTNAAADPDQPVSRETLLDAQLRDAKDTHHVEVRRIRIAPGFAAGPHVHNGPVVGSIVDGSVYFQVEGGPETILKAGDVFFEPEGVRIERFDARNDGVTFLAYFLLAAGQQPELSVLDE